MFTFHSVNPSTGRVMARCEHCRRIVEFGPEVAEAALPNTCPVCNGQPVAERQPQATDIAGPGTELARALAKWGLKERGGCKCKHYAKLMDAKGPDWCEKNLDQVVGWLKKNAKRQHLPFSSLIAKQFIKGAIARSRKNVVLSKMVRR